MSALLAMAVLFGNECLWWIDPPNTEEIVVECDVDSGWFVCGRTPTSVDSGPFGVSTIRYMPLLKLDVDTLLGQTFAVRIRGSNSFGESAPSVPVDIVWPEIWDAGRVPECGDGVATGTELCDGSDFRVETCQSRGFDYGQLTCNETCDAFDTAACQFVQCGNGVCEILAGEDCLSCPIDCNGTQNGPPAGRYCCGDGEGRNPVQCNDSRCSTGGNTCVD